MPARPARPGPDRTGPDGNETGGVRLPDVAVPTGIFTGWNLYREPWPAGQLADRDGHPAGPEIVAFLHQGAEFRPPEQALEQLVRHALQGNRGRGCWAP